ncbi:MAG: ATP-binding protein [Bifidobacteriaceae bacterium]|nr:ATP-binding protein [Bifidobacteriaceae bacterium]
MLIPRQSYVERIAPFIGKPFIKVITGIRRSGKSSLLTLMGEELQERGAAPERVLCLNFEDLALADLTTAKALHQRVEAWLPESGLAHLLLDEVQEVAEWEKAVNSLHARGVDIYLTGSNSRLLSSELATHIAGRYVATDVWPLSFGEFGDFRRQVSDWAALSPAQQFDEYLRRGGFPGPAALDLTATQTATAVRDIYASALLRDTIERHRIRRPDLLRRIAAFALDNIGNPFSASAVTRFLKSEQRAADPETIHTYLTALQESFLLARVQPLDLRGKAILRTGEKYYAADHSLPNTLLGASPTRLPGLLENIVWAELRRRGYDVHVGRSGDKEIDFVADRQGSRLYVQVAYLVSRSPQTWEREAAPLLALPDNHPKYVVSLDPHAGSSDRGIIHASLPEWLLSDDF